MLLGYLAILYDERVGILLFLVISQPFRVLAEATSGIWCQARSEAGWDIRGRGCHGHGHLTVQVQFRAGSKQRGSPTSEVGHKYVIKSAATHRQGHCSERGSTERFVVGFIPSRRHTERPHLGYPDGDG